MRLLILTQKIDRNDDVLGFFHRWVEEFAKHCEKVTVICLQKGEYDLPKNVQVFSLGKEEREKASRIKYIFRFYKYILRERKIYDAVFVHMNYEYVILGGWLWRLFGKKVGLWYAHGHVSLGLRIAEIFSHVIFTSTESGFRISSRKKRVVGQGIDVEKFVGPTPTRLENYQKGLLKIITVGRISPSKDYEMLLRACVILKNSGKAFGVRIFGGADIDEQKKYFATLIKFVAEQGLSEYVYFSGSVPNRELPEVLQSADLFVNMGLTGSLDKAILEAMASAVPILTCNEALTEVLGELTETLMYKKRDEKELAGKILRMMRLSQEEREKIGKDLRDIVTRSHTVEGLIARILQEYL